jgi:hypothetical protein
MKIQQAMIQNKHAKLFILVVGILTIINVTAVVTVLIQLNRYHNIPGSGIPGPPDTGNDTLNKGQGPGPAFLIRELGMNQEQQQAFRESRIKFRDKAMPLYAEIRQLNTGLAEEIIKATPDTLKLEQISKQIGELQVQIKLLIIKHLREVKSIATPEQQEKLTMFYRDLLSRDSGPMGKGMQHRHRGGRE